LARQANEYCAKLRDEKPSTFGFFASMPDLLDTKGTLAEIAYALDVLKADGITVFTRYGASNNYLGHEAFEPIWAELNSRAAVIFIHPTHPVDTNKVNARLMQPSVDYPHETTRTALDLLLTRNRSRFPNCKIILSHAGGTLPWMIPRTTQWRRGMTNDQIPDGITYDEMMADFRSFYFDLALSSSHDGLDLLTARVPHDHILYGKLLVVSSTTKKS
jgi:6-methylsalicylate decarboxylase